MVAVIKSEWHQIERRYGFELTREFLDEVYPDLEPDELDLMYVQIEAGERDVEEVIQEAYYSSVDIDWDWLDEDDMWTDRKGGYEVTYEVDATRELPTYDWSSHELHEEEPPMELDEFTQQLEELKIVFDFTADLERFKNDESIHQEIRDAFLKIIKEEGWEV